MADILKLTPLTYIVVLGAAISNFAMGLLEPTIGLYLQDLGLSTDRIGTIISARFLITAIGSLPIALFASRIGLTKFLYLSGVSAGLAGFFLLYGTGADAVWYFYLVVGISQAANSGPGAAILAENTGTKRVAAFALFSTTWMIPPALGAGTSFLWFRDRVISTAADYASIFVLVFWFLLITGVFYTFLLIFTLQRSQNELHIFNFRTPIVRQFKILFTPAIVLPFLMLTGVQFMMGAGAGSTLPFLPIYLDSLEATASQISLLTMTLNILMGIATQLAAPLSKRFGDINVFIVCTGLSVLSLLGIVFSDNLAFASTFYILRGTFANMTAPIGQSRVIAYIENSVRATGAAWTSTFRWIGWTTFSPISGKIIDAFNFETSFVFTAIIYVIATTLFVYVMKTKPNVEDLKLAGRWKLSSDILLSE